MIQFPCTCDHLFTVDDDQVGADIQCPDCGRLNTVPSAADLALLDGDGTYQIDGPVGPEQPNATREEELKRVFGKGRVDEFGREIDLRSHASPLDYQRVGVDPLDMVPEGHDRPAAPKYDPESGELIRPVEIRKDPMQHVRAALPVRRSNRKRVAVERLTHVSLPRIFSELMKPSNLVVMGMVALAHVALQLVAMIPVLGPFLMLPGLLMLVLFVMAHLGNVIDETGPTSRDELPRPLRDLGWTDDLWGPIRNTLIMIILCYGPAFFIIGSSFSNEKTRMMLAGVCAIVGTLFAPVVLLITQTSGSVANLRPDRVLGTFGVVAMVYPLMLAFMLAAGATYAAGYLAWTASAFGGSFFDIPWMTKSYVAFPVLLAGIFMAHFFCWMMGHVYRVYQSSFPWVYQGAVEYEAEPRAFEVINRHRPKPAAPPLAVVVPAVPLGHQATREEKLDMVRKSDAARKRESDDIINRIPDPNPRTPHF